MDLGKPIEIYGEVDISGLREKMLAQPTSFWEIDQVERTHLAGNRPGNAVYFYNDMPKSVNRSVIREAETSGFVSVLRHVDRPLYGEIQAIVEKDILPNFPECDVMRIQLAELPPGEVIEPHRDIGILAMIHRTHVPLVTHEGVKFFIQRQPYFLEEGRLYDLNNAVMHSVANESDVMRIHMLVDLLPNEMGRCRYYDTEDELIAAIDEWRGGMDQGQGQGFRRRMRN